MPLKSSRLTALPMSMRLPAEQRRTPAARGRDRGLRRAGLPRDVDGRGRRGRRRHQARPLPALPVEAGAVPRAARRRRRASSSARIVRRDERRHDRSRARRRRASPRTSASWPRTGPRSDSSSAPRCATTRSSPRSPKARSTGSPTSSPISSRSRRRPDHRRVLAHAIVGMAEATSRRLANDDAEDDPDRLAALARRDGVVRPARCARRRAGAGRALTRIGCRELGLVSRRA